MIDIPERLLSNIVNKTAKARIQILDNGMLYGMEDLEEKAVEIGLSVNFILPSGTLCQNEQVIAEFTGTPPAIIKGEDYLLSIISKPSGVATAAYLASSHAGKIKVVCGGWKKVLKESKPALRKAVESGGVETRMISKPFLYLDKNYVRMFGSIQHTLAKAKQISDRIRVIQLKGETNDIEREALTAAQLGADIIMVDTGSLIDFRNCSMLLNENGLRDKVKLALAGGFRIEDLDTLQDEDVDIIDIGRAILDAPLLDFRYDVF